MRWIRVSGLACAALAGGTLAACNLLLGLEGYGSGPGGASSASGMGASGSGGLDGGQGGDAAHDADAEAGPDITGGEGVWSKSFPGVTIASIAAGADGSVYLTGALNGAASPPCPITQSADGGPDAGTSTGPGYVTQLSASGDCVWQLLFGGGTGDTTTQGTGVAVDSAGHVALTGTFTTPLSIAGWTMTAGKTDSFVAYFDDTSAHNTTWAVQIGDQNGASNVGDQTTTGVAVYGSIVAVSGSYAASLDVFGMGGEEANPASKSDSADGFAMWFSTPHGDFSSSVLITSPNVSGSTHGANSIALGPNADVAFTGTTVGDTNIGNILTGMPSAYGSIFLASYYTAGGPDIGTVFNGDALQTGARVAFDVTDQVLVAGQFANTLSLLDGGPSYIGNSTSVIVAKYDETTKALQSVLQLGGTAGMTSTATIAGIATWPVPGFSGGATPSSVAMAGGLAGPASFLVDAGPSLTTTGPSACVYVVKTDSTLDPVLWSKVFCESAGTRSATAVAMAPGDSSVFVAGGFNGTIAFGGNTAALDSMGGDAAFIAKLTP
jgi:hypothetical protein